MNAVTYFTDVIKNTIPLEILDLALTRESNQQFRLPQNIGTLIKHRILPRLLLDFNLSQGIEIIFDIGNCSIINSFEDFTLLKIPEDILQGRDLISVNDLTTSYSSGVVLSNEPTEKLLRHTSGTFDANSIVRIESVSRNEILVKNNFTSLVGYVTATVSYSKELQEINPRYYMELSKLAILCAKAYIYNTMIVKLNEGKIYYGHEISVIERIVDSYEESNMEYIEETNVHGSKLLFMNDKNRMADYVKLTVGG